MSSESLLAAVERQFVDITHRQHVAAIKLTLATFIREAITILRRTEIRLRICNSMRISVIGTDHGIPAEVLLHTHLERMVTGVKTRGKHINRVITQKRPDRGRRRRFGGGGGAGRAERPDEPRLHRRRRIAGVPGREGPPRRRRARRRLMRPLLFAANWKLNLGPDEARAFARRFRALYAPHEEREIWFFPSAVSVEAAARELRDLPNVRVGIQDVHWEFKGAFTGANAAPLARAAGATAALVGHSERRHVFGETDEETGKKGRAGFAAGLLPVLCVGEALAQRGRDETAEGGGVVTRQRRAGRRDLPARNIARVVIA